MHKKVILLVLFLLVNITLASACAKSADTYGKTQNGADSGRNFIIVTSFYPMYISTINVARDIAGVEVTNMTKPQTGCLHDYQLKPDDLKKLERADAFVVNGAGMEAFLDKIVEQRKNLRIVDASKGIELIKGENGKENPHVWVSISDAIIQVKNISDQLSSVDPSNKEKYKYNSNAYVKKLEALKEKMHKSLDGIKNKDIITFHEAFPYFANEFGFNIAAVIEREPGTAPTPKEIENIIDIVKNSKINVLFAEPQYSVKAAETIASETGARIYSLDPAVTGEADPNGYDEYLDIMGNNLKTMEEALK